jgi:hypothetical protein
MMTQAELLEIKQRWRARHTNPVSLRELARIFRRDRKTISRAIANGWWETTPMRGRANPNAGPSKVDLVQYAKGCDTNTRIRAIMEKYHAST